MIRRRDIHTKGRARKERGVLLFVVVIVIAILTLGGISLLALMRNEREATVARLSELQLTEANRSAVALMQVLSELTDEELGRRSGVYDNKKMFCAVRVVGREDGARDDVMFTVVSPKFERETVEGIRYGLVNESTRLNLGAILAWDEEKPGTGREVLMKLPGMTAVMADSLLDWIDPDERTRPNGAESGYYAERRLPYSPRNALPIFLEELLLVRDVTRYQLYGADENYNFGNVVEKSERRDGSTLTGSLAAPPEQADGRGVSVGQTPRRPFVPWTQLLTVFSAERDVDPNGEARIDLNGDDLSFLFDELCSYVNEETAAFIVLYRQYGPAAAEQISSASGTKARSDAIDFAREPSFRLETPLDIIGVSVYVPDVEQPENGALYQSPFPDNRRTVSGLFEYLDYVSTAKETIISGRVNVNEAPRPVLEAIPGLNSTMVERILNARPAPGTAAVKQRRHAAWLYADGIVDLATMRSLWPKLTCSGGVWRGQIVGFSGSATHRAEAVVDGTVRPARQVFYKDLSMYGSGFSADTLLGRPSAGQSLNHSLGELMDQEVSETSPFADVELATPPDDPFRAIQAAP